MFQMMPRAVCRRGGAHKQTIDRAGAHIVTAYIEAGTSRDIAAPTHLWTMCAHSARFHSHMLPHLHMALGCVKGRHGLSHQRPLPLVLGSNCKAVALHDQGLIQSSALRAHLR